MSTFLENVSNLKFVFWSKHPTAWLNNEINSETIKYKTSKTTTTFLLVNDFIYLCSLFNASSVPWKESPFLKVPIEQFMYLPKCIYHGQLKKHFKWINCFRAIHLMYYCNQRQFSIQVESYLWKYTWSKGYTIA